MHNATWETPLETVRKLCLVCLADRPNLFYRGKTSFLKGRNLGKQSTNRFIRSQQPVILGNPQ